MGVLIIIAILFIVFYFSSKASEAKQQRQYKEIERRKLEEKRAAEKLQEQWRQITLQKYTEIARLYPKGLETWNRLHPESTKETIVSNKNKIVEYERLAKLHFTIPNRNEEEERRKRQEEEASRRREQEEARRKAELAKYKSDRMEIIKVLQNNGIQCFYHFTARENLSSIRQLGGLFSWYSMEQRGKVIPCPGGGGLSRQLDQSRGLEDYVRLSFTKNHPMMYVAWNEGRIANPVVLKINIDVAALKGTKYSNKNATIRREPVNIGDSISDLKQIHFQTVRQINHFNLENDEKSFYQAEVLVRSFIPIDFIMNLDNPIIP